MWQPTLERVAWHELGHVVVMYRLSAVMKGITLSQNAGTGEWTGVVHGPRANMAPTTDDEWIDVVAADVGGRLCVRAAINRGILAAATAGVELEHGDHGYYGGGSSDHANALKHSARVAGLADWKDAYREGCARAQRVIDADWKNLGQAAVGLAYTKIMVPKAVPQIFK